MSKALRKNSSEEIENELLTKEFLESTDYDFRRNTISEEPSYTLFVAVGNKQWIQGICKIEVILVENFTDLFFDFKGELSRIWVNKALVYYNHESPDCSNLYNGSILVISKSLLKPHLNTIAIEYKALLMTESKGLFSTEDNDSKTLRRYLYTLVEPNHTSFFMPVIGQLNVKGSFKLYICHSSSMKAVSNNEVKQIGNLTDDAFFQQMVERFDKISKLQFWSKIRMKYFEADHVVTEFQTCEFLPFNMFSFAVGNFQISENFIQIDNRTICLRFLIRQEWKDDLEKVKDCFSPLIHFSIRFFEELTGKIYPYKKFDTVFVKEFHLDSAETPGIVIMYEEYIKFFELNSIQQLQILRSFVHEISHIWFGTILSPRKPSFYQLVERFMDQRRPSRVSFLLHSRGI